MVRRSVVTLLASASALVATTVGSAVTASAAVVPSAALGPPAAVASADGNIQVFAVGGGKIWQNWQDPRTGAHGNWAGQPSPIMFVGTLALVPRARQTVIDIFARTPTDAIIETWYDWRTGAWGGWIELGAAAGTSDPSAVATADGHEQVFITAGGRVEENWFGPARGDHGVFTSPRVGPPVATIGRPAVVERPDGDTVDVFARAINANVLETWYYPNGMWGGWINLGGSTSNDPAAVPATPNTDLPPGTPSRDEVVVVDGASIRVNWFVPSTGAHGAFSPNQQLAPAALSGAVALASRPASGLVWVDVFARAVDGRTYHSSFETFAENVQSWSPVGGSTSNPPAAVYADGNDHVVTTSGAGAAVDGRRLQ
jgi:hypothetical protein